MERQTTVVVANFKDKRVFAAWEEVTSPWSHTVVQLINGTRFGKVASRMVPDRILGMDKKSQEFEDALKEFRQERETEAYAAIFVEYPELASVPHTLDLGDIVVAR